MVTRNDRTENLSLHDIVSKLRENKGFLREAFGVTRMGIFGSFARGEQGPFSDIDIVVEIEAAKKDIHSFLGLKRFLERETDRRIDLGFEHMLKPAVKERIRKQTIYV